MNTARFRRQPRLQTIVVKVQQLWKQGITKPDEIAAIIKQPDYVVIACLELVQKFERANQN